MRKEPLLVYLFIMLAVLVGYMFLDMNISRAENQADDSMTMAVITMLQSECTVNMQAIDRDEGQGHADIRVSGLKNFAAYSGKNIKFGNQAGKIWQELKQRAEQAGMFSAPGGYMRLAAAKEAGAAALDRDLKDFMSRAVENGFDFNF